MISVLGKLVAYNVDAGSHSITHMPNQHVDVWYNHTACGNILYHIHYVWSYMSVHANISYICVNLIINTHSYSYPMNMIDKHGLSIILSYYHDDQGEFSNC